MWGPVTGLTVAQEIQYLVNASLISINDKLEYIPDLAIESAHHRERGHLQGRPHLHLQAAART